MSAGEARQQSEVRPVVWPTEEEVDASPIVLPRASAWGSVPEVAVAAPEPVLPAGIRADSTHAYILAHPREAAAVLRAIVGQDTDWDGPLAGMTGTQAAAAFLIGLGPQVGSRVLQQLARDEWLVLTKAVADLPEVSHHACMHALEQVRQRVERGEYLEQGGALGATALLAEAAGPGLASAIMNDLLHPLPSGSGWLAGIAPDRLAPFLSHEHPQTLALVLSQLEPAQAAGILLQLPARMQSDVAYRIATMDSIAPKVLEQITGALAASLRDLVGGTVAVGGPKVVADILNLSGSGTEKHVLDQMDIQDATVAEAVRNLMFIFDDIAKLTDQEIQRLLREVDQGDLAIALKAVSDELKHKVLANVSEPVRTSITEQMEFLGPMRLTEVERIQLRIVQQVRQLEEQGQITIVRGEADDQFV